MLSANHRRGLLTDKDHDGDNNDKDDEKRRRIRIRVEAKEKEARAIIKERNKDCTETKFLSQYSFSLHAFTSQPRGQSPFLLAQFPSF